MKKRRPIKVRLDPEERYYVKLHGRGETRRSPSDTFCRLNNRRRRCNATHFHEAGYPMAVLSDLANWQDVHRWCAEQFRNEQGRTYTWTGEKFWFQTEADRELFVAKWDCRRALQQQEGSR